ncbi:MAG: prolipoprotein diacylglyceryl transferase [Ruminococcaceae bacterium]|nr:prolipoprotein diacylglyceryl transferase [Oscillospiraceae bacterium]
MLPFINVFGKQIPMYGLMMVTGAFFAILFACLRAKKRRLEPMDVLLASIFCFIIGLLGAKLLFIITEIPSYIAHFGKHGFSFSWLINEFMTAGIVFYGGMIGGVFGGWLYTRLFRLDFWKFADLMIPFLPLAHGFGRIGCFCAGCCYGRAPLDSEPEWLRSLAVVYTKAIGAPNDGVARYPVQLFEACFLVLVLLPILVFFSRKERRPGMVVGLYFIVYGVFRFINEYLRADSIRGIFGGVSTSQWISIALVPLGILLMSGLVSPLLKSRYPMRSAAADAFEIVTDDDDCSDACCAVCTECGECGREAETAEPEIEADISDADAAGACEPDDCADTDTSEK